MSFTELFFDLAIVSSTARLSEYAGSEGLISFDLRFGVMMFAFWYAWHQTNLLYNISYESGLFRATCICIKISFLTFMASYVTEHQTHSDDLRFGYYYIGTKLIDAILVARVLFEARTQNLRSSSLKGITGNIINLTFHIIMWVLACAFSSEDTLIPAYTACEIAHFFGKEERWPTVPKFMTPDPTF